MASTMRVHIVYVLEKLIFVSVTSSNEDVEEWTSGVKLKYTSEEGPITLGLDIIEGNMSTFIVLCVEDYCVVYSPTDPLSPAIKYFLADAKHNFFVGVRLLNTIKEYGVKRYVELGYAAAQVLRCPQLENADIMALSREVLFKDFSRPAHQQVITRNWDDLTEEQRMYICGSACVSFLIGKRLFFIKGGWVVPNISSPCNFIRNF